MRNYDPAQIFLHIANIRITGFADGTFVTIDRITESFTSVAGASGEVARIRSRDKRGMIRFTLLPTHPDNDSLSTLIALDESLGTGVGVFSMSDGNGTSLANASNTWCKKYPALEYGKDLSNRDWEFECDNLDMVVGGNR